MAYIVLVVVEAVALVVALDVLVVVEAVALVVALDVLVVVEAVALVVALDVRVVVEAVALVVALDVLVVVEAVATIAFGRGSRCGCCHHCMQLCPWYPSVDTRVRKTAGASGFAFCTNTSRLHMCGC